VRNDALYESRCSFRRLGEVAPLQTGFAFKSEWYVDDGVRLLRNANVHQGFLTWDDVVSVDPPMLDRFAAFRLNQGDIVLTLDRPVVASGLKVARLDAPDLPALLNQRVARFRPDPEQLYSDYLYAFLRSPGFVQAISGHDQSLGVPHISPAQVEKVEIPVPSLDQQRRVAGVLAEQLAAADTARQAAEGRLTAAEMLIAAYVDEVFSGSEGNSGEKRTLREIVLGAGQYGTSQRSNAEGNGLPVLGMPNIHKGRIRWHKVSSVDLSPSDVEKYELNSDDILFNRTNSAELVGKTAVFDGSRRAVFASYLIRFRADPLVADPHFISAYINSRGGRAFVEQHMARAIGQVNISASTMHRMPVPCPPLETQRRLMASLSERLAAADGLVELCRSQVAETAVMPHAFLRAAFQGDS
jgi:restriction endonuclease S subunit